MATRVCNAENCGAVIAWNNERNQFEDQMYPGEKHDHAKYRAAAANHTEASNDGTTQQKGRECYTCRDNGFPKNLIYFNAEKKSPNGKMIPLASPNKVNGQWITHTHKMKQGTGEQPQPESAPGEPMTPEEKEWVNSEAPAYQNYSEDEIKQLLGEYLNKSGELIAYLNKQAPMIESIFGYINAKSIGKASDLKHD